MHVRPIAAIAYVSSALVAGCMIIGHHYETHADNTAWLLPAPNHELQIAVVLVTSGRAGNPHTPWDFPKSFREEEIHWFRLRSAGPVVLAEDISYAGEMAQDDLKQLAQPRPVRGGIILTCATATLNLELPVYDKSHFGPNYPPIVGWKTYAHNGTYSIRLPTGVKPKTAETANACKFELP